MLAQVPDDPLYVNGVPEPGHHADTFSVQCDVDRPLQRCECVGLPWSDDLRVGESSEIEVDLLGREVFDDITQFPFVSKSARKAATLFWMNSPAGRIRYCCPSRLIYRSYEAGC